MSKNKMVPICSEAKLKEVHEAVTTELLKKYGGDPAKLEFSNKVLYYSKKFMWERPIGCSPNFRMSDLQNEMSDYIKKSLDEEQPKCMDPTHPDSPKGFFITGTMLALWVVGAIISWVIQRFLTNWYNEK